MQKQKSFDDIMDVISEQIDILSQKRVMPEQRKNARELSRMIGCYISASVHKAEYDKENNITGAKIPLFENRPTGRRGR